VEAAPQTISSANAVKADREMKFRKAVIAECGVVRLTINGTIISVPLLMLKANPDAGFNHKNTGGKSDAHETSTFGAKVPDQQVRRPVIATSAASLCAWDLGLGEL
jgi:hypothetical protein